MSPESFNTLMLTILALAVILALVWMGLRALSDIRFDRSYARYRERQYQARVDFMADRERCKRDARAGARTNAACDRDERERMSRHHPED